MIVHLVTVHPRKTQLCKLPIFVPDYVDIPVRDQVERYTMFLYDGKELRSPLNRTLSPP